MDGTLTQVGEDRLISETSYMITQRRATIPDHILDPLFCFMRYTLVGALHLNKFAAGSRVDSELLLNTQTAAVKRKRVVDRLSQGFTRAKRRCFQLSRLKDALRGFTKQTMEEHVRILESHVVVTCPSRRSVELSRSMSTNAKNYLMTSCGFSEADLAELTLNNSLLTD